MLQVLLLNHRQCLSDNPVTTKTDALKVNYFPLLFINVIGISTFPKLGNTFLDFNEKCTFSNGLYLCLIWFHICSSIIVITDPVSQNIIMFSCSIEPRI